MFDPNLLRGELEEAAASEGFNRWLEIFAVLHRAFEGIGYQTPILVGGAAIEFYTRGGYATSDLDALLFTPHEKVDSTMISLGFQKHGRHWIHGPLNIFVEFPGSPSDDPTLRINRILIKETEIKIESLENALLTRLCYFDQGQIADGITVLALISAHVGKIDWHALENLAKAENLFPLLEGIKEMALSIDWLNPPERHQLEDQLYYLNNPERSRIIEKGEEGSDGKRS